MNPKNVVSTQKCTDYTENTINSIQSMHLLFGYNISVYLT